MTRHARANPKMQKNGRIDHSEYSRSVSRSAGAQLWQRWSCRRCGPRVVLPSERVVFLPFLRHNCGCRMDQGKSAFVRHDERRLNLRHWVKSGRSLLVPVAVVVLIGVAHAQNLDQGKPPAKLFASSCAGCHHSARGLAKGRFNLALFWFLQQHYTASSSSAWTLTSYLESVDGNQRNQARGAATKSSRRSSPASPRPAAPIAGR
jgi:hypothetical protein